VNKTGLGGPKIVGLAQPAGGPLHAGVKTALAIESVFLHLANLSEVDPS